METYDFSDYGEDPNYVVRNTICWCLEDGQSPSAPKRKTFECSTKKEVWDKKKPIMKCLNDYDIKSLATCQDWCKRIDPSAYEYKGFSGSSICNCGAVQVCNDNVY